MRYHKLPRLFIEEDLKVNSRITLSKPQSHYLISVMRRKLSDNIILFNGKTGEYLAQILEANKNAAKLVITEKTREIHASSKITLVYSPVKNVKSEYIVQKATELGVASIQPCVFERTIKPKIKDDKLKIVAIEAAEQCERLDIPQINELESFASILPNIKDKNIILCDETGKGKTPTEALSGLPKNDEYILLIGPEGGFSDAEIEQIYALPNTTGIGLGPRILRADTAIITALAFTQNYLGDFNQLPEFRG